MVVADMHAHYVFQLIPQPDRTTALATTARGRRLLRSRLRTPGDRPALALLPSTGHSIPAREHDRLDEGGWRRGPTVGAPDLYGFIEPTLAGCAGPADMKRIEVALTDRYGPGDAELICSGNGQGALLSSWGAR